MKLQEALLHLSQFERFKPVIDTTPLAELNPSGNVYYDLLESIVSQQLSVKAADTIFKRFLTLFPDQYPHPASVALLEVDQLRSVGLSFQKSAYIKNVATFAIENQMENMDWHSLNDQEIISQLTTIKGVGVWTVQMILIFSLQRPDVFPVDDLGVQQGLVKLYQLSEQGKELKKKMLELSEPWRPYRSVAARLLWRWKDQ